MPSAEADVIAAEIAPKMVAWLGAAGVAAPAAAAAAASLATDGYDSVRALRAGGLGAADLLRHGMADADAHAVVGALAQCTLDATSSAPASAPASAGGVKAVSSVDPQAVPLDDMLIQSLVKLAGGQKKVMPRRIAHPIPPSLCGA